MNSEQRFFIMSGVLILFMLFTMSFFIWIGSNLIILGIGGVGLWFMSEYFHRVILHPLTKSIGRSEGRLIELKRSMKENYGNKVKK